MVGKLHNINRNPDEILGVVWAWEKVEVDAVVGKKRRCESKERKYRGGSRGV
jgi:hypothetical protein